jgi:hypothetical protein
VVLLRELNVSISQTKGLSLEEIDDMYQEVYPWQSHRFSGRRTSHDIAAGEKGSSHDETLEEKDKA